MNVINYDIELTEDGDFFINNNGDLSIIESNKELANSLFVSTTGDWKQNPLTTGLNLLLYLNSSSDRIILEQEIRKLMKTDGFDVQDLVINYDVFEKLQIKTNALRIR